MALENAFMAARNLAGRKSRSALTVLGIVVGVAAISLVWAFGTGLENNVTESFNQLGSNTLIVMPGTDFTQSAFARLEPDDAEKIEQIAGIDWATPLYLSTTQIEHGAQKKTAAVIGIDMDDIAHYYDTEFIEIEQGRKPTPQDKGDAVLGNDFAHKTFDAPIELRETIHVHNQHLRVITILKKSNNTFASNFNNAIIVDRQILANDSTSVLRPNRILVRVQEGHPVELVQKRIENRLERLHDEKDFSVLSPTQLADSLKAILGIVQIVLLGLAAISLVVGGLGIMNTVFMNVTERISEIGIMKAMGATKKRILIIFLTEAAILGLIGSIGGLALAFLVVQGATYALDASGFGLTPVLEWPFALIACIFGMVFGILSGIAPARWASNLDAVDAIRFHA